MNKIAASLSKAVHHIPAPWLSHAAYALCLALPWLLIFSRGGSDGAGVLIAVMFLLHSWQSNSWQWTKDPIVRACALAWGWMLLLASPFAVDIAGSFSIALPWGRWLLLYAALVFWVLSTPARLRTCALNIAFMLCLVMIDTIWQYIYGISLTGHVPNESYRLTGPMDNVKVGIFIAKLAFPISAILIYQAMQQRRTAQLWSTFIFLAACIATVMLSGERTAFFTCLLAFGVIASIIALTEPAYRVLSLSLMAGALVISLVLLITQPILQDRLEWLATNIVGFKDSSYGQLDWVGYQLGITHPLTGAGLKGFRLLCEPFLASGQVTHCNLHPHNPYVEWFAELGVAGLLMFIYIITTLCKPPLQAVLSTKGAPRILAATVLAILVMHFFPLMATQSFFSNWPALLLWYSIAIAMAALNMVKWHNEK